LRLASAGTPEAAPQRRTTATMTTEEILIDLLRTMQAEGNWKPGDRFWIQVRKIEGEQMTLRFFNHETGQAHDRMYPTSDEPQTG